LHSYVHRERDRLFHPEKFNRNTKAEREGAERHLREFYASPGGQVLVAPLLEPVSYQLKLPGLLRIADNRICAGSAEPVGDDTGRATNIFRRWLTFRVEPAKNIAIREGFNNCADLSKLLFQCFTSYANR